MLEREEDLRRFLAERVREELEEIHGCASHLAWLVRQDCLDTQDAWEAACELFSRSQRIKESLRCLQLDEPGMARAWIEHRDPWIEPMPRLWIGNAAD